MQAANVSTASRIQEQLTTRLPLVWFSLAFLAGVVFASLVALHILGWVALIIVSMLLILAARILPPRYPSLPSLFSPFTFVLLLAFFLGAARYQLSVRKWTELRAVHCTTSTAT